MTDTPLNAINPPRGGIRVEVYDEQKWDEIPESEREQFYDTAMFYGKAEIHRGTHVATITRTQGAHLP